MSADTCRPSSSASSLRAEAATKGSSFVRPQPVTESSLLDSVAGFINEVQALNKPSHDSKIQITWASFQRADINDPALFSEIAEVNGEIWQSLLTLLVNSFENKFQHFRKSPPFNACSRLHTRSTSMDHPNDRRSSRSSCLASRPSENLENSALSGKLLWVPRQLCPLQTIGGDG